MTTPSTNSCPELDVAARPLIRSSKIATRHLAQLAIVYVRQSSPRQVRENVESTQLQYDLVIQSARLNQVDVLPYLTDLLRRLPAVAEDDIASATHDGKIFRKPSRISELSLGQRMLVSATKESPRTRWTASGPKRCRSATSA